MARKPAVSNAIDQALDTRAFEYRVLARLKYLEAVRDRKLDRSALSRKPSITESVTRQPQFKPLDALPDPDYDPELEQAVVSITGGRSV